MTSIHVAASRQYDVVIEQRGLSRLGAMAAALLPGRRAAVISDDTVFSLYGAQAEQSLTEAGFQAEHFVFPHGEQQKNLTTYGQALNYLCDRRFTRSDLIVALGGGVVGDLGGFTAATYQRGIACIQVPTTLLSMMDSSVGGKTAVDLDSGKNQAGCFYQPSLVLCDPALLASLPESEYRAGCAEIIKTAVLFSPELFQQLKATPVREQFEAMIAACVEMKRDVVQSDEFDRGQRALLNLGHTIGHAVEACSNFTILHGEGVAIGLAAITRAAVEKGICDPALDIAVRDLYQERKQKDITDPVVFSWYFSARTAGGQEVDALVTPELRELVQQLENASSNAKVSCLILRGGKLTLALQTRYVFAGIPPELDMRDIDGIRRWFTASLTGMGGLLDILQESPALTGAEK